MKKQQLWQWNWASGGWNQCYAFTKEEALSIARQKGAGVLIVVELSLQAINPAKLHLEK